MKVIGFDKKEHNLSNELFLLYWAKFCSSKQDAIAPYDKIKLVNEGIFKDKKAISNALYQLHMKNFIVKHQEDWYITDLGEEHLANWFNASKSTNASSNITPDIKAYIAKLEAENAKSKELLAHAQIELDDQRVKINTNEYLAKQIFSFKEENDNLKKQLESYKVQIANIENTYNTIWHSFHGIDNNIKIAFQNCAKAFNIIAGMY